MEPFVGHNDGAAKKPQHPVEPKTGSAAPVIHLDIYIFTTFPTWSYYTPPIVEYLARDGCADVVVGNLGHRSTRLGTNHVDGLITKDRPRVNLVCKYQSSGRLHKKTPPLDAKSRANLSSLNV